MVTIKYRIFGCHDAKWALLLLKKLVFAKQIDFPKIQLKNVDCFNLVHAHKPKLDFFCGCPFLAIFLLFFSPFFLSLPFTFHILSGSCKKLGINYGQSLEMGP